MYSNFKRVTLGRKCRKVTTTTVSPPLKNLQKVISLQRWYRWRRAVRHEQDKLLHSVKTVQRRFRRKFSERHLTTYFNDTCFVTLEPLSAKWQDLWFVHQQYRFTPQHLLKWLMDNGEFINPYTRQPLVKGDLMRLHAIMRVCDPYYEELDFHIWEDRKAIRAQALLQREQSMLHQFWTETLDHHLTWFWNLPEDMDRLLLCEYQDYWDTTAYHAFYVDFISFFEFHAFAALHYMDHLVLRLDQLETGLHKNRLGQTICSMLYDLKMQMNDGGGRISDLSDHDDDDDDDDDDDIYYEDDDDDEEEENQPRTRVVPDPELEEGEIEEQSVLERAREDAQQIRDFLTAQNLIEEAHIAETQLRENVP